MAIRSVVALLVTVVILTGCGGIAGEVKPGEPMARMCEAAQAQGDAVGLGRAAVATRETRDGSSGRYIAETDLRRQSAASLRESAGQLEAGLDSPSPGYAKAEAQVAAAQPSVEVAVRALVGRPNTDAATEARLLDEAAAAVLAIEMSPECVRISTPSAAP